MGNLNILITGAGGFIGGHCVSAAVTRGHSVKALVRRDTSIALSWERQNVEPITIDLAKVEVPKLAATLEGVDVVIHTAASLAGNDAERQRDTLDASAKLFDAVANAKSKPGIVLVSSITVYDTQAVRTDGLLDETTPLEPNPAERDPYCQSKLAQEQHAKAIAETHNIPLWIIRPGAVFGPNRLWNDHIGPAFGNAVLRLGRKGQVPLCYIDHCAEALVIAAEQLVKTGRPSEAINLLDNDLPDRGRFITTMAKTGWPKVVIPWSWRLFDVPARLLRLIGLSKFMPGLLRPSVLHARAKPIRYSNDKMRNVLGEGRNMLFDHAMASAHAAEVRDD